MPIAQDEGPWYRQRWPWIIIAGPASAVVAGMTMLWFAIDSNDGLVVDDYYKQGLAINQVILRDRAASELRYRAVATLTGDGTRVRTVVSSASGSPLPAALYLHLAHPTRAGKDQTLLLTAQPGGGYEASMRPPEAGRWLVTIEDAAKTWRLAARWQLPDAGDVLLEPPDQRSGAR